MNLSTTTLSKPELIDLLTKPNPGPMAIVRRQNLNHIDVLAGHLVEVDKLAHIPLNGPEVLALVPFRQVTERGFAAIDDGAPLLCLVADQKISIAQNELVALLPEKMPEVEARGFDISDEEYAQVVHRVLEDEIGRGEGANFVIRRDFRAHTSEPVKSAVLAWLRDLLTHEAGAYWTFAFISDQIMAVGASPERHVSQENGLVLMNPISGTLRHSGKTPDVSTLLAFLDDRKESEELVMVVDEELKMMSAICPEGGVMCGPFLKPMTQLTHTEYLLKGHSELDPREVLRLTMFAPTVTGSPMGNACRVIARHETSGRGYYSGVIARFTPRGSESELKESELSTAEVGASNGSGVADVVNSGSANTSASAVSDSDANINVEYSDVDTNASAIGDSNADAMGIGSTSAARVRTQLRYDLDAPILIRTAFVDLQGNITVSAGATLVRHSNPLSEAAETRVKASGALASLGLVKRSIEKTVQPGETSAYPAATDPKVQAALADRNRNLAPFWRDEQVSAPEFGASAILVDCGDDFTNMLAHQLHRLGLETNIVPWDKMSSDPDEDLVVFGPGPGNPLDDTDERVQTVSRLLRERLSAQKPTIAVCLSHQILCRLAGLEIVKLPEPRQGLPLTVPVLGQDSLIGFYNTFSAKGKDGETTPKLGLKICADKVSGDVITLTGPRVASVQGHLESVLSYSGFQALSRLVDHALNS